MDTNPERPAPRARQHATISHLANLQISMRTALAVVVVVVLPVFVFMYDQLREAWSAYDKYTDRMITIESRLAKLEARHEKESNRDKLIRRYQHW